MPQIEKINTNKKLITSLAGGMLWVIVGMLIARILGYGIRAVIAHAYGVELYGFINTGLSLMMIFAMVGIVGLNTGVSRQISFYRAKFDLEKVHVQIFSAYKITFFTSVIFALVLYITSEFIAENVFKTPELTIVLKIFSFGIPLYNILEVNTSIFKGLKQIFYFTFYHDILRFFIILVVIAFSSLIEKSFTIVILAYPISYVIIDLITLFILMKKTGLIIWDKLRFSLSDKEILMLSMPLMLGGIFWLLLPRTDTIIIGVLLDQASVGLYNAAVPIGQLILLIRQALSPIVLPLFTELFARNDKESLSLMYYISVKWTSMLAIPLFVSMMILPQFYISLIFSKSFLASIPVLRIIIIGYFLHTVVGPTSNLLVILGDTKKTMINSIIAFICSIGFNLILIPKYKLIGAGISSVISFNIFNILCFIQVYQKIKIQPFRLLHIKFVVAGLIPLPILYYLSITSSHLISISAYFISYILLLIFLRAIKNEDLIVFNVIKSRFKQSSRE